MDDYLIIILLIATVFSLQVIVWIIKDMDEEARSHEEVMRWLDSGKG